MDVTAKTKDGKVVFSDEKIYMPQSTNSRGDKMVYGPGRKMGIVRDTSLQPMQTKVETYEIKFPYEDVMKEGKKVRDIKAKEMDIEISLWHQPLDLPPDKKPVEGKDRFLFYKTTKTVAIK